MTQLLFDSTSVIITFGHVAADLLKDFAQSHGPTMHDRQTLKAAGRLLIACQCDS